jgi:AraC-like DNA-binding protein
MLDHGLPERAITAFEELHALSVTVHDPSGLLWPTLDPARLSHRQPPCLAVKALLPQGTCQHHDGASLRTELATRQRDGRVHVCHAGFVEWVVPGFHEDRLEWILFAGLRRPGLDLVATVSRATDLGPASKRLVRGLQAVRAGESDLILESLRQLAARLRLWMDERRRSGGAGLPGRPSVRHAYPISAERLARRRSLILFWIDHHHARDVHLPDLARHLGLSASRAGHAVMESCGQGFVSLLRTTRLRSAANLLRHSELGILEVALRSGFADLAHFHRVFRTAFGMTPRAYRLQSEGTDR